MDQRRTSFFPLSIVVVVAMLVALAFLMVGCTRPAGLEPMGQNIPMDERMVRATTGQGINEFQGLMMLAQRPRRPATSRSRRCHRLPPGGI